MKKIISIFIATLFIISYTFSHPEQEDNIKQADLLLDMMEYKAAIDHYLKALSENPRQRDIRMKIGYAYFQEKKIDDALKYIKEEVELFPDSEDAYDLLVFILFSLDKLKEANKFLERYDFPIGLTEENPFIGSLGCFILGMYFKETEEYDKAKEYFRRALEKGYDPDKCYAQLRDIELAQGELDSSREFTEEPGVDYYRFINDIDSVLENINYLGLEFIRQGKLHEAIRRFRNGIKIYPESPEINFNLGMVYFWQNNLKKAEKHALIALRQRNFFGRLPDHVRQDISRKKRNFIHGSSNFPLSEWTFDAALKEGNHFLDAYDFLGTIYFEKGELDKSVLAYKKVIEINPEDPISHYNLGLAYHALKHWENAEMEWKKAIKHETELKRREEREEISKDQLSISLIVLKRPVSFRAHKSLGKLYLDQNLPDKALKEFEKAIELESGDPEPYYELGKIYQAKSELNKSNIQKAIFYYEKYIYLGGKKEAEVKELLKSLKEKEEK